MAVFQWKRNGVPAVRKDRNGRERPVWACQWKGPDGKQKTKTTFTSEREARRFEAEVSNAKARGIETFTSRSSITIEEAITAMIADAEGRLERSSVRQYGQHKAHIVSRIGGIKLADFSRADAIRFQSQLQREFSPAMATKVFTTLKTSLGHAHDLGQVAQNVAAGVKRKKVASRDQENVVTLDKIPSKEEARAMLDYARKHDPDFYRVLLFAISTGLRASEQRGLKWADVDFKNKVVHVRRRADAWGALGKPKTAAGNRSVEIGDHLLNILRKWKLEQPKEQRALDFVFPHKSGSPVAIHSWYRVYWPVQVALGITSPIDPEEKARAAEEGYELTPRHRYDWHALRHFCVSAMIASGHSVVEVSKALGHARPSVTSDVYAHLFRAAERKGALAKSIETALLN